MNDAHTTVLVVGLGSIGRRHARLLSEREDVHLLLCDAVASFVKETSAQLARPARKTFSDYAAALAAKPDLVVLATPNHLHVPMGLAALEAGCDLVVEKPVSNQLDAASELVGAAERAGRFLHVGYILRFDDGLNRLRSIVNEGGIGTLVGGRAMVGTYITLLNARSPDRASQPNSLIVDYTHEIDFIRWFFGRTERVLAMGSRVGDLEMKPEPNIFQAIMQLTGGALVQVHMDYVQHPQRRSFELFGDRGTLSYDFITGEIRHFGFGAEHRWTAMDVPPVSKRLDDLFRVQRDSVLARRRAGEPPVVSGADGLAALTIAEAMIESAAHGKAVTLANPI